MQFDNAYEGPASGLPHGFSNPYDDRAVMRADRRGALAGTLGAALTLLVMAVLCIGMIWLMGSHAGR